MNYDKKIIEYLKENYKTYSIKFFDVECFGFHEYFRNSIYYFNPEKPLISSDKDPFYLNINLEENSYYYSDNKPDYENHSTYLELVRLIKLKEIFNENSTN